MKKLFSYLIVMATIFLFPCGWIIIALSTSWYGEHNGKNEMSVIEFFPQIISVGWIYFLMFGILLIPIMLIFIEGVLNTKISFSQLKWSPMLFTWLMTTLSIIPSIVSNFHYAKWFNSYLIYGTLSIAFLLVLSYYTYLFVQWIKIQLKQKALNESDFKWK